MYVYIYIYHIHLPSESHMFSSPCPRLAEFDHVIGGPNLGTRQSQRLTHGALLGRGKTRCGRMSLLLVASSCIPSTYIYISIYIHASRISDYMCAIIWHRIVTQWWYYILCFSGEPVLDHSRCHHARNILGIDVRNARHAAIISPDLLIVQNTSAINEWIDMNREIINWNKIKKPVTVVHVRSASIPLLL